MLVFLGIDFSRAWVFEFMDFCGAGWGPSFLMRLVGITRLRGEEFGASGYLKAPMVVPFGGYLVYWKPR